MSDQTLFDRAVRKARQEFDGDERRSKPGMDWVRLVPIVIALGTAVGGYAVLQYRVGQLEQNFRDYRADQREVDRAQWSRIGNYPEAKK